MPGPVEALAWLQAPAGLLCGPKTRSTPAALSPRGAELMPLLQGRPVAFLWPLGARETPLSITFCCPHGWAEQNSCTQVPQRAGNTCLSLSVGFSTLKRPCGHLGPRVPSPAPCGRTQQYWTKCPASETLIYFPSPQVQRAVPGPISWANIFPLLRIQAAGRKPAPPNTLPLSYYLSCSLLSVLTSSCHLCVYRQ